MWHGPKQSHDKDVWLSNYCVIAYGPQTKILDTPILKE